MVTMPVFVDHLVQDLRSGSRILKNSPGLSSAAVLMVALVVGANTTVFSIAHGILKKPAPGVTADGLLRLNWIVEDGFADPTTSYVVYQELAAQSTVLQPLLAFQPYARLTLTQGNESHAVKGTFVSENYFSALGVDIIRGRTFTQSEVLGDASGLVAVISHRTWNEHFRGAEDIVGRSVLISAQPVTIIGVVAPSFRGALLAESVDVWLPIVSYARAAGAESTLLDPSDHSVAVIGRIAPGKSMTEAESELGAIWARLQTTYSQLSGSRVVLVPYSAVAGNGTGFAEQGNMLLTILSVITLLTLLIVCANVANLLIARAAIRHRELAVRQSLGASRVRILRMLLAEGATIASVAMLAAFACAWWVSRATSGFVAPGPWRAVGEMDFTPSWTVAAYALALSAIGAMTFTLAPVIRTWRLGLLAALKTGEQSVVQGRSRLASGLVVVQLGLSVLLLTSSGLLYRSLSLVREADPGFDTQNVLLVGVNTSGSAPTADANGTLLGTLVERLRTVSGVTDVTYARLPPFRDGGWPRRQVTAAGSREPLDVRLNHVGPAYFRMLGLSPALGREFVDGEARRAINAAVINQSLAATLWPSQSPIGKVLQIAPPRDTRRDNAVPTQVEVVGVVPDATFGRFRNVERRFLFVSAQQEPAAPGESTIYIRYAGSLGNVATAVVRSIGAVDPQTAIESVQTLESGRESGAWPLHALTMLLTLFAGASLFIAGIGQYAVVSFEIRRRVREFGIRMSFGASSGQVLRSVLSQGLKWTAVGLLLGFALSVATGRALGGVLYGITPTDAVTYAAVCGVLAATSLVACYLPARRASRIDPMRALRQE